jgi:cytochrome d ubiquinol oxidase subunit I
MLIASFLTVAFLLAGISAYRALRGSKSAANAAVLRMAIITAALLIPVQMVVGDSHGLNTLEYQPAKVAAMEGIWNTEKGAPAVIFAIPNSKEQKNDYEISIPKLASLYLTHSFDGEVQGLKAFPDKIPPVAPVFFAFRIMVGVGVLMMLISWVAVWLSRGQRSLPKWMLQALVWMTFSGWLAVVAGWYVTEIGRQPYLVSGVLTTAQAVTKLPTGMVLSSLLMYLTLYIGLIISYIAVVFHLARQADLPATEDRLASAEASANALGTATIKSQGA